MKGLLLSLSLTILGNKADISPNLQFDGINKPKFNPIWKDDITLLKGTFWSDWLHNWPGCGEKHIFDGLAFYGIRLDDLRRECNNSLIKFNNILFNSFLVIL